MYKIKHISNQQLNDMVGTTLGAKLWVVGMMNELRRYPNEIPCEPNEIPSMCIPFATGDEKVEWGFAAGTSCLSTNQDGSILVQNAEHFPNCAVLAILNLLYDGGITNGKKFSIKLHIPNSPEIKVFTDLLTEISTALRNLSITKVMVPKAPVQNQHNTRAVLAVKNSVGVVQALNQIDIGRFVVKVNCVNGSFRVGDNITVTDGSFQLLQEHCPVMQIVSPTNQVVQSSDDLDDDVFFINLAMWFPPNTPPFNGLMIIKETVQPPFTPRPMPKPFVLQSQPSFLEKLFGRK